MIDTSTTLNIHEVEVVNTSVGPVQTGEGTEHHIRIQSLECNASHINIWGTREAFFEFIGQFRQVVAALPNPKEE